MGDGRDGVATGRLWRVPRDLFKFTTTERGELHAALMEVFGEAHERLVTALALDDIRQGLDAVGWLEPLDDEAVVSALGQLARWGLVDVTQDHAHAYASAEEYERKNLRYTLTRAGEAAVAGVQHALAQLEATGALQTAVLEAIVDRLAELARLLADPAGDDRRVYQSLFELEGHLDALRTSTKQFNSDLQRLLRDDAEQDVVRDVKAATVAYLEQYVTSLDQRERQIAEGVARVEEHGIAALHQRALNGADLPGFGSEDPAGRWLAQRMARWEGLRQWFRPVDGSAPRAEDLRAVAQRAIVSLLRVLEQLRDRRRRPASLSSDFRTLARWFAAAPSEAEAHRLWAAFGLWPARHAHLVADDPEDTPAGVPWAEAAAVPVSPLLRTRGRTEHVARTAAVRDTTALRRRRQAEAARERAEVEAAWARLATEGRVRLSDVGELDPATFARLLELVGRALAAPSGRGGVRRAVTSDGQLEVVLGPAAPGARARLHTPVGVFEAPDYDLEVRSLVAASVPPARAEESA